MKGNKFEQTGTSSPLFTLDNSKQFASPEGIGVTSFTVQDASTPNTRDNTNWNVGSRAMVKFTHPQEPIELQPAAKAQYLNIATGRAFPHVQRWFLDAAANMYSDAAELRRTGDTINHYDLQQRHFEIANGRAEGVSQQDAHLELLQGLQSLRQCQSAIATAWLTAFREAAAEYMSALRDMEEVLTTRRRLAEEWTSHGQREVVVAQIAWVQERNDSLVTRAAREKKRESILREQTTQHINEAMDGLVDDMGTAVSWATQQRIHGRVFARSPGALSKTLDGKLSGEDGEERRLLSEARKLRLELRDMEQRNKCWEEKGPKTKAFWQKKRKAPVKGAKAREEDVAPQAVLPRGGTTDVLLDLSLNDTQREKEPDDKLAAEGAHEKETIMTIMNALGSAEAVMPPEEDIKAEAEDQARENTNDDRGGTPEDGVVFPSLAVQTQVFRSSNTNGEGKKNTQALDDEELQRTVGSSKAEFSLPRVIGSSRTCTPQPPSYAGDSHSHQRSNLRGHPKSSKSAGETVHTQASRSLNGSIRHRTCALKRPSIVQPPSKTGHNLTGRQKVDRLAGLLSVLKEDTLHFDTERVNVSQSVCEMRKELQAHRATTAHLLHQTNELETRRVQLRMQCEAQQLRLRSGLEGQNIRIAAEDVDTLILNGELEHTVKMLQNQTQRRRAEAVDLKQKINELQTRITEYDTVLRCVREYWRRNAVAVKHRHTSMPTFNAFQGADLNSGIVSSSRLFSLISPNQDSTSCSKSSLHAHGKVSGRRQRGGTGEAAVSGTGVRFLEGSLEIPNVMESTLPRDASLSLKPLSMNLSTESSGSCDVQKIPGEVEKVGCGSYESIPTLELTDPEEIAEFIYSLFVEETGEE